jgi:hypothetical protein
VGVVAVHRVADVHAEAAVQVVALLQRGREFGREPVGGDVQIVVGVQLKPTAEVSTMRIEMPLCRVASGSVRTASQM